MTVADEDDDDRGYRLVVEDLQALLSTPVGRRVLWRLIERTGLFGSSFSESATTAAYSEGRRSVGIELMDWVQREAPNRWIEMVQEALGTVR